VRSITYVDGTWHEGNPLLLGPMTHATWMASAVFDGARAFAGVAPDLDRHCARLIRSAEIMGFAAPVTAERVLELAWAGIGRFPEGAELYIRPLIYTEEGFVTAVPESARFILTVFEEPMPAREGLVTCLSRYRRPAPDMAPTEAKASCLYPNVARALREVRPKGFHTAVMLDANGNVAEFATANLFAVKDGAVLTPAPNGTFLDGITRRRVIALLRADGCEVIETTLRFDDLLAADELFATGNYSKVVPVVKLEDRDFQRSPVSLRARELYFDWAMTAGKPPG
jgi:branched-chain amino acid aminotransferase